MKQMILGVLVAAALLSSAEAKGGRGVMPIPPSYDYSREKAPGYKKDYCEDSIGNHILCVSRTDENVKRYQAMYR